MRKTELGSILIGAGAYLVLATTVLSVMFSYLSLDSDSRFQGASSGYALSGELEKISARSASHLAELFATRKYDWPPASPQVPRIELLRFPLDLDQQPVKLKKRLFFSALLPIVLAENARILRDRLVIKGFLARGLDLLPAMAKIHLSELQERYRVKGDLTDPLVQEKLLRRADEVPVGLVLAQAANESGWGTSRFTREGNSLFGQWTYRKTGSGLVPQARDEDAAYRVRSFPDLRASVRAYLRNINVGHAYGELRRFREQMRVKGEILNPLVLAQGLLRYSQRGEAYVDEIKAMIVGNRLHRLFPTSDLSG